MLTEGFDSYGIDASAGNNVVVTSYAVKTYGADSTGISASSLNGNTTVNSTFVYTGGNYSTGIFAYAQPERRRDGELRYGEDGSALLRSASTAISLNGNATVNSTYV